MTNEILQGWQCPVCENIISPYELVCPFCNQSEEENIMFFPYDSEKTIFPSLIGGKR